MHWLPTYVILGLNFGMNNVLRTLLNFQAHVAIAECEKRLAAQGRRVVVITQNIDELHKRAGSSHILELHGNFKLK